MVWSPISSASRQDLGSQSSTPPEPCRVTALLNLLNDLVYPTNDPNVFSREFTGEDLALAGLNMDLIFQQFGRLKRIAEGNEG